MTDKDPELVGLRERTKEFALRIINLYTKLPNDTVAQVIGKQMLRSGTSVGAHYREATRARSTAEFVSKIDGGLQELDETEYWIDLLIGAKIFSSDRLADLLDESNQLIAILTTCSKNAKDED